MTLYRVQLGQKFFLLQTASVKKTEFVVFPGNLISAGKKYHSKDICKAVLMVGFQWRGAAMVPLFTNHKSLRHRL